MRNEWERNRKEGKGKQMKWHSIAEFWISNPFKAFAVFFSPTR